MKPYFRAAIFCTLVLSWTAATAADDKPRRARDRATEVVAELTATGEKLEAEYESMVRTRRVEIVEALPELDDTQKAALLVAFQAEEELAKRAKAEAKAVEKLLERKHHLSELQDHLKYGPDTMDAAEARLQWAQSLPDDDPDKEQRIKTAQSKIEARQKEVAALPRKIEKAQQAVKDAEAKLPEAMKQYEAAAAALEQAKAKTRNILAGLPLDGALGGGLDTKLAQYTILSEATPRRLAEFAQRGPKQRALIEQLFSNTPLMVRMLVADGAYWGKYGRAMEIYTAIQRDSDNAGDGVLRELALAVALEHAVPIERANPESVTAGPEYLDPVKRYLSFEKAYLDGELDPSFQDHCAWSLRMVVTHTVPDETYAWGRRMLRNYRPDLIEIDLDDGRYVNIVNAEIRYSSAGVKNDRPELQQNQNILDNGGICGRRAGFGRFILRAFGVPAINRPQKGHAALVHYAPTGWVPQLGAGWGHSNRTIFRRYRTDLDFRASTRARQDTAGFLKVKRAQWIGHVVGEEPLHKRRTSDDLPFWNTVSLIEQQRVIDGLLPDGKPRPSKYCPPVVAVDVPEAEREVTVDKAGVITIPAAAACKPTRSTKVLYHGELRDSLTFIESNLGGIQLHFSKYGAAGAKATYEFDAPNAGAYQLTAKVVTPGHELPLNVTANGGAMVALPLPYTMGNWGTTEPVIIVLTEGRNTLTVSGPSRVCVKEVLLTPSEKVRH